MADKKSDVAIIKTACQAMRKNGTASGTIAACFDTMDAEQLALFELRHNMPKFSPSRTEKIERRIINQMPIESGSQERQGLMTRTVLLLSPCEFLRTFSAVCAAPCCVCGTRLRVELIDTPGHGDIEGMDTAKVPGHIGHRRGTPFTVCGAMISQVLQLVKSELYDAMQNFHKAAIAADEDAKDKLIHACFYFIRPHRLEESDLVVSLPTHAHKITRIQDDNCSPQMLRALHQWVPVVLLIAQSDTMTKGERASCLSNMLP